MTPEQFCYWMQGFVELSGGSPPTTEQWDSWELLGGTADGNHLQQVFNKVTAPVRQGPSQPIVDPSKVNQFDRANPWANPTPFDDRIIC